MAEKGATLYGEDIRIDFQNNQIVIHFSYPINF